MGGIDVPTSAIHIATALTLQSDLIPALEILYNELDKNSCKFSSIRKLDIPISWT